MTNTGWLDFNTGKKIVTIEELQATIAKQAEKIEALQREVKYLESGIAEELEATIVQQAERIKELEEALRCIDEDLVNPVYYRLVKEALAKEE